MSLVIGIDMDGVLCDFTNPMLRIINEKYDLKLSPDDIKVASMVDIVVEAVEKRHGKDAAKKLKAKEIFSLCEKNFFSKLRAFPGAVDAVKELYHNGCEIIFITKILNWTSVPGEKAEWLAKRFKDIEYSVVMVEELESKRMFGVDVLIDDDSRSLTGAQAIGVCVEHPWNEAYRNDHPDEVSVKSLKHAAKEILTMKTTMEHLNSLGGF